VERTHTAQLGRRTTNIEILPGSSPGPTVRTYLHSDPMRLPVFCVQLVGDLYPLKTNTQPLHPPNASETYSSEGGFDSREETGQQPRNTSFAGCTAVVEDQRMLRPRYYTTYFDSGVKQLQLLAVLYDTPCTTFGLRTGDDAGGVNKAQLPGEDRRGPGGPRV